jgi:hypothetical protein
MAHPQAVGIGERQTKFAANLLMIFDNAVQFAADVLSRRLNSLGEAKDFVTKDGIYHEGISEAMSRYYAKSSARCPPEFPLRFLAVRAGIE